MSDSEEASFASADEGDGSQTGSQTKKKDLGSSKKQKEKQDGRKTGHGQADTSDTAAQTKRDTQKVPDKQQQQQSSKIKGKGDSLATQKQAKTKPSPPAGQSIKLSPAAKTSLTPGTSTEKVKPAVKQQNESIKEGGSRDTSDKPSETETTKDISVSQGDSGQQVYRSTDSSTSAPREDNSTSLPETKQHLPEPETVRKSPVREPSVRESPVRESPVKEPPVRKSPVAAHAQDEKDVGKQLRVSDPAGQDIPRGHQDHTQEQENILDKLGDSTEKVQNSGGGWGWSSWGSSILSAATNSVQTFTHQVGDGFTTIMETVESSLGAPNPEEIVKAQNVTEPTPTSEELPAVTSQPDAGVPEEKTKTIVDQSLTESRKERVQKTEDSGEISKGEKREKGKRETAEGEGGESWFSGWNMADLAKKVQDTGKSLAFKGQSLMSEGFDAVENLAAGGIDVLESIGKKTYNTLSEHDPAFRKTRDYLSPKGNKPNLSSVLKEAKDKAEYEADQARENEESRKAHFGTLFDNYQGIAHLEALEILSNQSEKKVHSLLNALSSLDLTKIKPTLISIKESFEISEDNSDISEDQDFSCLVSQHVSNLELGTAPDKLNKVHEMVKQWLVDFDSHDSHESDSIKEVHQKSIQALAELTAKGVEQFHKAGELVLFERDKDKDCTERAHSLARLTGVLCHEIGNLASKFVELLNKMSGEGQQTEEVTPLVTNVYLEATNSSTYIQDAFQLLLPVLQHAALEHFILSRQS